MAIELSYSYHLSTKEYRAFSKADLMQKHNHNMRAFANSTKELVKDPIVLAGSKNIYADIKNLYSEQFDEVIKIYNEDQVVKGYSGRQINDYIDHINNSKQQSVAEEILFQLGDKKFWDLHECDELEYKKVFENQLEEIRRIYPNFIIANATVHFDESSPHMHVIGVPVGEFENGLAKRVSKRSVFTPQSLSQGQDEMRLRMLDDVKNCLIIDRDGNNVAENLDLKEKTEGNNYTHSVEKFKVIQDYKKELDAKTEQKIQEGIEDGLDFYRKELAEARKDAGVEEPIVGMHRTNILGYDDLDDGINVPQLHKPKIGRASFDTAEVTKYIKTVTTEIENKDDKISKLQKLVTVQNIAIDENKDLRRVIMDKNNEILELSRVIDKRDKSISKVQKRVESRDTKIGDLKIKNNKQNETLNRLKKENTELTDGINKYIYKNIRPIYSELNTKKITKDEAKSKVDKFTESVKEYIPRRIINFIEEKVIREFERINANRLKAKLDKEAKAKADQLAKDKLTEQTRVSNELIETRKKDVEKQLNSLYQNLYNGFANTEFTKRGVENQYKKVSDIMDKKAFDEMESTIVRKFKYEYDKKERELAEVVKPKTQIKPKPIVAEVKDVKPEVKQKPQKPKPIVKEVKPKAEPIVEEVRPVVKPVIPEVFKPMVKPIIEEPKKKKAVAEEKESNVYVRPTYDSTPTYNKPSELEKALNGNYDDKTIDGDNPWEIDPWEIDEPTR